MPHKIQPSPRQLVVNSPTDSGEDPRIICSEQLFPEQRLQVQMAAGSNYELKVVWCRRLGPSRYAAGCVFIETPPAASEL